VAGQRDADRERRGPDPARRRHAADQPWNTDYWYVFAVVAGASLLTKYVIKYRGTHVFNPSNIGLVAAFVLLGSTRVEPLDFWWAPLDALAGARLRVIIVGGLLITRRLHLLACGRASGSRSPSASGCSPVRPLHDRELGVRAVCGVDFWRVIVTSPEVLIFLFFMITDPKTAPRGRSAGSCSGSSSRSRARC
jgi:hypothetical protein